MTQDQEGREHQQMKEVWSLWQMLLKKIVVQHELSRATGVKNSQENACGRAIHIPWHCSTSHADVVTKKLRVYGWEVLPHLTYSPDLSPPDFDLFPELKEPRSYAWTTFSSMEELSTDVTQAIRHMNKVVYWME